MKVPASKVLLARLVDPLLPWLPVPSGLRHEWMSRDEAMVMDSRADRLIVSMATPRWYLDSRRWQDEVMRRAEEFHLPMLMMMGDADPVSDPRAAHEFYERSSSEDKTFRLYPDRLHEVLRDTGREELFQAIHDWMRERAEVQFDAGADEKGDRSADFAD
jgi:lysophospholipase